MAGPGFDIAQFRAYINNVGVLKPNKFLVRIFSPRGFASLPDYFNTARQLEFWCEAANVPGVQIQTHDVRRYGYGPTEKKPVSPVFTDVRCSFFADGEGQIWTFFQQWLRLINNYDMSDGIRSSTLVQQPFELAYKHEYVSDIHIISYDEAGNEKIHVVLQEAFPIFVGDIQLNWQDNNQIMRIPVTFTFFNWFNEILKPTDIGINIPLP